MAPLDVPEITEADVQAAEARMAERRINPLAVAATYDRRIGRVVVVLDTGLELAFPPHLAQGLEGAKPADLAEIEISPTGLGLHFPRLDADLYVPALLEGVFGSEAWTAARMGRAGGRARSAAKAAAARLNGKRGGRPRKSAVG
jgi:hypothetical protein